MPEAEQYRQAAILLMMARSFMECEQPFAGRPRRAVVRRATRAGGV